MSNLPRRGLSPAQIEIMEIVWERGEVAAIEVREILSRKRSVARETVRTILQRMEGKGWLKHRVIGRTHFYSAAIPREASIGHKVVELIETLCGGYADRLFEALLDYRGLTDREAQQIRTLIEQARPISE